MMPKAQKSLEERVRRLPRLRDVVDKKMQDPQFAELLADEMAALRLGLALCEARERLHLTQQDIEARVGIPQETLSRIERGRLPSLATLQKIAKALDIQVIVRPDDTVTVEPFVEQKAA